jgi:hypothetical protein
MKQISRRVETKPFDAKDINGSLLDLNKRVLMCESNDEILSAVDFKL